MKYLLDFLDINEDENITKEEVENFFLMSYVTDLKTKKKISNMIEIFFPEKRLQRNKRELI